MTPQEFAALAASPKTLEFLLLLLAAFVLLMLTD